MATIEQLSAALVKADAAGNTADAKVFADALRALKAQGGGPTAVSPPPNAQPAVTDSGKISLLDLREKQTGTGKYAPPSGPPPDVSQNPMNSVLPGPLGQLANTIQATTRGGMQVTTLNMGDELMAGVTAPFRAAYDMTQGNGFDIGRAFQYDLANNEKVDAAYRELNPQAYDVGGVVGSLGLMGKARPGAAAPLVTKGLPARAAATSGAAGAAMGFGTPGSLEDRLKNAGSMGLSSAVIGGVGGKVLSGYAKGASNRTPTVDGLFKAADNAFKAADNSGMVIPTAQGAGIVGKMRQVLIDDGAITPSGKVADFPKINHAMNLADDYATAPMSVAQLRKVRKQLGKAAASMDKDERRLAMQMLKELDQSVISMGGQGARDWATGRQLWHTAEKGKSVEGLIHSAERQHRKTATVPLEQATRNKFDAFTGKDSNLRGFSPAEREALNRVSNGTRVGNTAKQVGRLAPTTVGGLGFKAGVPYMVGQTIGGPVLGGAAAGATLGLGYIGKFVSHLSTKHAAELARVIVLNGGKLPAKIPPNVSGPVRNALGNIMLMGGANVGNAGEQVIAALAQSSGQLANAPGQ